MNTSDSTDIETAFFHIGVRVYRNSGGGLVAAYDYDSINVTYEHAVILYELRSAPPGVMISGASVTPQNGFSKPTIGASGRLVALYDLDGLPSMGSFGVSLSFTSAQGETFESDPQIINRPVIR